MKNYTLIFIALVIAAAGFAQENVYPAKMQEKAIFIANEIGRAHV